MNNLRNRTLRALVGVALGLTGIAAVAQDFPTLQGTPGRTGRNTGAALTGPGRGLLTWYRPIRDDSYGRTLIRDEQSTETTAVGVWPFPALNEEAFGPYFPSPAVPTTDPVNVGENAVRGLVAAGGPGYRYSFTIPSAAGSDPRIQNFVGDSLNTFTWNVEPPVGAFPNQRFPRNYALYVWMPQGPTNVGGNLRYPSRYWVYEVTHGTGSVSLDVVDTFAAGGGWVRLGGGGFPTNRLYDYDGVNPIRIRLYNTLPRRPGRESDTVTNPATYPWLNTYFDTPYTSVVYADAVRAEPTSGNVQATPLVSRTEPGNIATPVRVYNARNNQTVGTLTSGRQVTVTRGEITAHDLTTGNSVWTWSPIDDSTATVVQDNTSAGVTATPPWAPAAVPIAPFQGTNYLQAPITITAGTEQATTYAPTLADGSYEIQVWQPGSRGAELLGTQVQVLVDADGIQTPVTVDQDAGGGWVRLGTGRWNHSTANPLRVLVTNLSTNAADAGRFANADAIRFIGNANLAITSTPVVATAQVRTTIAGATAATGVTVVAAEDGRIYCLRSAGNGTGGTDVFWAYPSLRTPDPNQVAAEDGVGPAAQMPTNFDLSSALIVTIGGQDYLYVASRNGRIYCLEMAGRGDQDFATRTPGTTRRVWTYPDDFPAGSQTSRLGPFRGSLSYAVTANGPTIFAPTAQGRIYALEALPGLANKTTNVFWTFPPRTSPTLGAVLGTPTAANGRLFFGTQVKTGDDRGRFYALDWDNGAISWQFNGTTQWDPALTTFVPADDFISGAAYAEANLIAPGSPEMLFVANENRWITAFDATNGTILWTTNELATGVRGNLSLATMDVFTGGGAGATGFAPQVMVPTTDGRFVGLFANSGVGFGATNVYGTKRAWQYSAAGDPIVASLSVGHSWMFGADSLGFLYGFNNLGDGFGNDIDGPGPGRDIVENDDSDPDVQAFRDAKIIFVTQDTYQRLRLPDGDPNHLTYAGVIGDPTRIVNRTAFDWGETIYALVYDFPYQDVYTKGALTGSPAPPPVANFQWSVEGAYVRNVSTQSRRFRAGSSPVGRDGYGLGAFVLQGAGSTMLPPGSARVTFSLTTSAITDPPRPINIQPNPAAATRLFAIANPLGLIMGNTAPYQIGNVIDPSDPQNAVNGSPDITATAHNESLLTAALGMGAHGQSSKAAFGVVDRSLMTLLRGDGLGLENVRFYRSDLARQGGKPFVYKPIDSIPFFAALYASGRGLEDYPTEFPNPSSDYPDVPRERIRVTKDPLGNAENPLFNAIGLNAPTNVNTAAPGFPSRDLNPTPFEIDLDVPRFTPPVVNSLGNHFTVQDSNGGTPFGGYYGGVSVFVDTDGDGSLTRESGRREAFRSFWLAGGVAIDERLAFGIESIDFGSIAHSSGLDPAGAGFTPYAGPFMEMFKPFILRNEGNTNMLNVRIAKEYGNGVGIFPWEIFSKVNDDLAWLDGSRYVSSSLDPGITGMPSNVFQKARVGDLNPSEYRDNPNARANPFIGAVGGPILAGPNPDQPLLGVRTPLGFPVGAYNWFIRAFEDAPLVVDQITNVDGNGNSLSAFDDLGVQFLSRESRLTNSNTPRTGPMIDPNLGGAENFLHTNVQPTAVRSQSGHMVVAFASDRFSATVGTGFDKAQPTAATQEAQFRLYLAGIQGGSPTFTSPLSDLNNWSPTAGRWFNRTVADYPTTPAATLFPGEPVIGNTLQYTLPTFPVHAFINPYGAIGWAEPYLGFVASFSRQVGSERVPESRLMLARVDPNNGSPTIDDPIVLDVDPRMRKGKMSLVQASDNVTVFYTAGGTGQSVIHYITYNGSTTNPTVRVFDTGSAFDSVGSPSALWRRARGVGDGVLLPNNGQAVIDVLFQGKLRGRDSNEVFLGRMNADVLTAAPLGLFYMPVIDSERLVADPREAGTYRSQGIRWNTGGTITLQYDPGTGPVAIEIGGTRQVDRTTGIITMDTQLGKAFLNPNMGTVRLSSPLANRGGALTLTYQPRFLRVSGSGAGYASPQMFFDTNAAPDNAYWAAAGGGPLPSNQAGINARYMLAYSRAATSGETARPYMQSLRFGIQLPEAILTDANGNVVTLNVTGATRPWQVDPANGRIYFEGEEEGRTVTVTVNSLPARAYVVGLITEKTEAQIPIEQAVNESQPSLTYDPVPGGGATGRRPPLFWLFYTSTRGGAPDVFFQSLAPRFTPLARNP